MTSSESEHFIAPGGTCSCYDCTITQGHKDEQYDYRVKISDTEGQIRSNRPFTARDLSVKSAHRLFFKDTWVKKSFQILLWFCTHTHTAAAPAAVTLRGLDSLDNGNDCE